MSQSVASQMMQQIDEEDMSAASQEELAQAVQSIHKQVRHYKHPHIVHPSRVAHQRHVELVFLYNAAQKCIHF